MPVQRAPSGPYAQRSGRHHGRRTAGPAARLSGRTWQSRPLDGGLTNRNFHVTTDSGEQYVARLSNHKSALLGIDRAAEFHNTSTAAAAGVAPGVVAFAPDDGLLLVEWIAGRTFAERDLDDETALARVADLCRQLHAAPPFVGDFDMFDVQQRYLGTRATDALPAPGRLPRARGRRSGACTVRCGRRRCRPVPCHNDLLAANIMDDGARLWFIDYEYAGNNDPCFELGNIWSEAALDADRLDHLVTCYFGAPSPVQVARARLFGLLAQYGWTLWASIQASVSDVDFDFWDWGLEKYARARAELAGPALDDLISTVLESTRR